MALPLARWREINMAFIHIRLQNLDAELAGFADVLAQLGGVGHVVRHHGAQKFHRVIRLQIGGLIGDDGVGGGVRFVEAVAREFFQQIKNLVRFGRGNVVHLCATLHENFALFGHFLRLLFAHGAPQQIRAAERVARQHLRRLHDLFLVNQNAVGLPRNRFKQRMFVSDFHFAVAALDEFRNELHRAGPVKRHQRGDVFDGADLKFAAQIAHPAGFQLEHAERFGAVEQVVCFCVIQRQIVNRHFDVMRALDHFAGIANDGECLQPEKIHLQQAEIADGIHRVLRDERAAFVLLERQQIHQGLIADDDAGGVDAGVARDVFKDERGVDQFTGDLLGFVGLLEFRRLLERLRQIHFQVERNHFRQPVAIAIGQTHHAADVAHDTFRAHRAEGDDLRDGIVPVFFADIFDDVRTAVVGKINVDIRRIDAFGI